MEIYTLLYETTCMGKALWILAIQASLFGNPTGGTIVSSNVAIHSPSPEILHIQADHQSIIHWDDFSISLNELTKFIQPSSDSAVLNRVA